MDASQRQRAAVSLAGQAVPVRGPHLAAPDSKMSAGGHPAVRAVGPRGLPREDQGERQAGEHDQQVAARAVDDGERLSPGVPVRRTV